MRGYICVHSVHDSGECEPCYRVRLHKEMTATLAMLDRLLPDDVVTPEQTAPTAKEHGASWRAYRALAAYARHFPGGGLKEAETLEAWYLRTAPKLDRPQGRPFLGLLREMASTALMIPVDELDALVQKSQHGRVGVPTHQSCSDPMCRQPHAAPTLADPLGMRDPNAPAPAPPTYPSPDPNYVPQHVQRARTSGAVVLDPNRMVKIHGPDAVKDSLLNPTPRGFVGADKLPYDSDID